MMVEPSSSPHPSDSTPVSAGAPPRRRMIVRSAGLLAFATIALVLFIVGLGDVRRKSVALEQVRTHADVLETRRQAVGALPMDLAPDTPPDQLKATAGSEFLAPSEVRWLRNHPDRVWVFASKPVARILASDGRAVIFFQAGRFVVEWMTLAEFTHLSETQRELIERMSIPGLSNTPENP